MLVLTRKPGEHILIGDGVVLTVVGIQGTRIRIGIQASPQITVKRMEVQTRTHSDQSDLTQQTSAD